MEQIIIYHYHQHVYFEHYNIVIIIEEIVEPHVTASSYRSVIYVYLLYNSQICIKRSPLKQKKNLSFKTGDLLKDAQLMKCSMTGQEKCDLLIQVTAWADLTNCFFLKGLIVAI